MKRTGKAFLKYIILIFVTLILSTWISHNLGVLAAPPSQDQQEISVIFEPADNATVQGVVQLIGSADHPAFQFYVIEVAPEPLTGDQWQFVGDSTTPVINGPMATWDTTVLPDGLYTLRLRVVRLDGNYSEAFSQQVTVSNAQSIPTNTPPVVGTPPTQEQAPSNLPPTVTPTSLPPTPTILVEQPIVDTPTPRPVETSAPLENPEDSTSLIPEVTGFALSPLRDACLYGGILMLVIFVFFGFLSMLRVFVQGFTDRIRRQREKRTRQ
jgi:hypothetical protein